MILGRVRSAGPTGIRRPLGFTLTEILTAILLLAILAAVTVPTLFGRVSEASTRRKASTLSMLGQAIMTYHDHVGMWPSSLVQLTTKPAVGDLNICGGSLATKDV